LHKGIVLPQNFQESAKYFKLAADRTDRVGQLKYGICCYRGEGISMDFAESVYFFKLSADVNDGRARRECSNCFAKGCGVPLHLMNLFGGSIGVVTRR
jgi:TPR repeat protein